MPAYIVRRLVLFVPVLVGVSFLVFLIFHLTPGDSVRAMLGEAGQGISAEEVERIREQLGLDRPWYVQYVAFLSRATRGDLGRSFRTGRPVLEEIASRFPFTARLAAISLLIAVLVGVPAGVVAALRARRWPDIAVMGVVLMGVSMPVFWLGILLMQAFSLNLRWLPPSGSGTWRHMVLPAATIAFASVAFIARMTRSALMEQLGEDYVRTARAKGLRELVVVGRHALRGTMIPVLTTVGLQFGSLLGGAVVVETIFGLPGLGRLTVDAIQARDLPMIQGAILWIAVVFNLVNLVVDVLYVAVDPRIRYR